MEQIPLNPVPNQRIAFNLDGGYWQIHLFESIDNVCADVILNGVTLISGTRCFPGIPLLPYGYLQSPNYGNFAFDNDVDWRNFNANCNLWYLQETEWEQFQLLVLLGEVATAS